MAINCFLMPEVLQDRSLVELLVVLKEKDWCLRILYRGSNRYIRWNTWWSCCGRKFGIITRCSNHSTTGRMVGSSSRPLADRAAVCSIGVGVLGSSARAETGAEGGMSGGPSRPITSAGTGGFTGEALSGLSTGGTRGTGCEMVESPSRSMSGGDASGSRGVDVLESSKGQQPVHQMECLEATSGSSNGAAFGGYAFIDDASIILGII